MNLSKTSASAATARFFYNTAFLARVLQPVRVRGSERTGASFALAPRHAGR
jgi:hypothetical protein